MASRRPLMPALCALRQAARHSHHHHHQQPGTAAAAAAAAAAAIATAAAGPRTFSSIAAQPCTQRKHKTAGAPATRWRRYYSQEQQQQPPPPPAGNKIWSFEDVQKLTQEAKPNVVIVDVREPGELQSTGRIPGAVNIPVASQPDSFHISDEDFEDRFGYARPGRDQEVVFYCKAGVRSRAAAGLASEAGWASIGEYPGSWLDWAGKGGKVER